MARRNDLETEAQFLKQYHKNHKVWGRQNEVCLCHFLFPDDFAMFCWSGQCHFSHAQWQDTFLRSRGGCGSCRIQAGCLAMLGRSWHEVLWFEGVLYDALPFLGLYVEFYIYMDHVLSNFYCVSVMIDQFCAPTNYHQIARTLSYGQPSINVLTPKQYMCHLFVSSSNAHKKVWPRTQMKSSWRRSIWSKRTFWLVNSFCCLAGLRAQGLGNPMRSVSFWFAKKQAWDVNVGIWLDVQRREHNKVANEANYTISTRSLILRMFWGRM